MGVLATQGIAVKIEPGDVLVRDRETFLFTARAAGKPIFVTR
jgi:hypothetical protein